MNDSRLEPIELKIAFLERANQELSDVVYRQQRELELLRAQMAACQRQLETLKSDEAALSPADERPPHY